MPERADAPVVIRDATPQDDDALLAVNNAAAPHVNTLTAAQLSWLRGTCEYSRVALLDGAMAGFVFAMRSGKAYWSANYAWFGERFDAFLYLDRIVVAAGARRRGVGERLYADVAAFARGRWPRITLEVNVRPPNPESIAFHEAMGYRRVGSRTYDANEVAMFERPL